MTPATRPSVVRVTARRAYHATVFEYAVICEYAHEWRKYLAQRVAM
jgi:hypothetical protein